MKILVVDREEDSRGALEILERIPGNEIQSARSGEEALEMTQGQQVDLLITEVILEPMNGFTLRNKMETRHPGVRTVFLTGYDLSPYAEHTAGYEVVAKPATPGTLLPAMARATAGAGMASAAPAQPAPAPPRPEPEAAPAALPPAPPPPPPEAEAAAAPVPQAAPAAAAPAPTGTSKGAPVFKPVVVQSAFSTPLPKPMAPPKVAAVPAGSPVAAPKVAVAPKTARLAVAAAADPLVGTTIGSYRIERRLGKGKWGPVYLATQTSMNRLVAMELLAAEVAGDQAARENFVATARAKASVQHPHILSVYEAAQADGSYFYTHEYVDGSTLAQLAARGEGLSEPMALQAIKYVAQGLAHLHHHKIAHTIPDATDIYIGKDGLPYLSNVALPTEEMPVVQEEICALAGVIRTLLPGGRAHDPGLESMLIRMAITTQAGFQSWPPLFQAIQAIEPRVIPADAFKLSAQDKAAIRAVEDARRRQRRVVIMNITGLLALLCVLAFVGWYQFLRPETQAHDYSDEMIRIPAGEFIFQNGQKIVLPDFYIDKYEVTMFEYGKFLDYLKDHGNPTEFDSPLQPAGGSHVPQDWDTYYGRASAPFAGYRTVRNVPISLDCPAFNVNYYDAYAYAKWKGHRLPSEQEWEKAARGPSGNLYPWGNDWDPEKVNAGTDYEPNPAAGYKPLVDGYNWWAPVAAILTDRSYYGVIGMGGNVSEWTNTWDASKTYVVIRGGNFKSTSEAAETTARIKAYPDKFAETLGFRTVSDNPPK
jgi:formylglycine-generating enzyme required for sulfatase activity/CheY-like chemotaxis protein